VAEHANPTQEERQWRRKQQRRCLALLRK